MSFKSGWDYLQTGGIFPIAVVKVEADYAHLSPQELEKAISGDLPASFWTVDIRSLKNRLKAIAWVQSVSIEKVWPETLKIRVNEKKVLARWGNKGLISDKKEIFYPAHMSLDTEKFNDLPKLYGPSGREQVVLSHYDTMSNMLQSKHLSLKTLLLSDSSAWVLRLENGTLLLLGIDEPLKRLSRFLRSYDTIFNSEAEEWQNSDQKLGKPVNQRVARRVDLRYPHGMAVAWEKPVQST